VAFRGRVEPISIQIHPGLWDRHLSPEVEEAANDSVAGCWSVDSMNNTRTSLLSICGNASVVLQSVVIRGITWPFATEDTGWKDIQLMCALELGHNLTATIVKGSLADNVVGSVLCVTGGSRVDVVDTQVVGNRGLAGAGVIVGGESAADSFPTSRKLGGSTRFSRLPFHHVLAVICTGGDPSFQANDSFFFNNSAQAGGAVDVFEGKVGMAHTIINNCSALLFGGGGVAVLTDYKRAAQVIMDNCNISDCRAKKEVSRKATIGSVFSIAVSQVSHSMPPYAICTECTC